MKKIYSREEQCMIEMMLQKLNPELRQRLNASGCNIHVDLNTGSFDVIDCAEELRLEILNALRQF